MPKSQKILPNAVQAFETKIRAGGFLATRNGSLVPNVDMDLEAQYERELAEAHGCKNLTSSALKGLFQATLLRPKGHHVEEARKILLALQPGTPEGILHHVGFYLASQLAQAEFYGQVAEVFIKAHRGV
jgi:hypothetical protein